MDEVTKALEALDAALRRAGISEYNIEKTAKRARVELYTASRHVGNYGADVNECMAHCAQAFSVLPAGAPPRAQPAELGGEGGGWS